MKPKHRAGFWILMVLLILMNLLPALALYCNDVKNGALYSVPAFVLSILAVVQMVRIQYRQIRYIAKLNDDMTGAEKAALQQLPYGYCLVDQSGVLLQCNAFFAQHILPSEDWFGRTLVDLVPFHPSAKEQELRWQERDYRVSQLPYEENGEALTAYLWEDVTDQKQLRKAYQETRPCVMLIMLDNYEDLIQNAKESAKLETSVAVEKLLEQFISQTNGILRRMKNDRFYAVIEERHVQQIIAGKFHILDEARRIRVDEKNTVTFSIGVGHGAQSLQESETFAMQCLDMAVGRGGDQAAVRTENGYRFFGGVSKGIEKKSRAKTRIIASAMQDLIKNSEHVFIMGHRFGDLDSVGAACGLAGAIRLMGKTVEVVVDPQKNLAPQLIAMMRREVGLPLFVTPAQAMEVMGANTLLIIVDTHSKDILESDRLYQMASNVVVVDHHRKNVNFVDNAVIFHHEPYASSACEMVAELLQYFKMDGMVSACYADCLLSGIMLDTKNFVMRTGVRTFEAAAFLRKIGADTVKVKCLFSGSIESYRSRTEIVGSAEIIGKHAISVAPSDTEEVRLVAPQAADELLSIENVDAAFVIYEINRVVSISARSLGAVNVQVIMEQLGGGGHQTMAATQIPDISVEEAKRRLIAVIRELQE